VICVVSMRRILQVHTNITERYARQGVMAASARHLRAEEPRLASKLDCPFTKPHATCAFPSMMHVRAPDPKPGESSRSQPREIHAPESSR